MFNDNRDTSRLKLQLMADGADCAHCPLSRNGQPHRPVASEVLKPGAAVALVGEAPGKRETQVGRPFIGISGKILDQAIQRGGVHRTDFAILNAIACGPIPSQADGMKQEAMQACRPRLLRELARLQPKVILAVGGYALKSLGATEAGVTAVRGATLKLKADVVGGDHVIDRQGRPRSDGKEIGSPIVGIMPPLTHAPEATRLAPHFMATLHPAHIARGGDGDAPDAPGGDAGPAVDLLFYFFMYDVVKAVRLARGEIQPWTDSLDLFAMRGNELCNPVFDDDDNVVGWETAKSSAMAGAIDQVYEEAREATEFAVDVETDSKDAMTANLTAIAFATSLGGMSATWEAWQAVPTAKARAAQLLADRKIAVIIQNRIYDTIVLPRHGMPIGGIVHDTLLQHHAAFPGLPHKLQAIATQFFVTRPWKDEFRRTEKDQGSLILYNGRDTVATARAKPVLEKMIDAHRTAKVYEADRQQFSVATHMRRIGYFVDRVEQKRQSDVQHARLAYMRDSLVTDFKAIEEPWRKALARILASTARKRDPESYLERVALRYREIAERERRDTDIGLFKPKAHKDVLALFEILKVPILDYTKKGAPKTDKKAMEAAAGRHPLLRKIIHLREAKHLLATYIDGLPILADGRVHPDWSPKITGRWGAGKAQNWPKFVQGWPPEKDANGNFKRRPSGELVTPKENPRRIVSAPTSVEIIRIGVAGSHAIVYLRALQGFGRMLVGADFSQLELRIAAFLARDPFLLNVFRRGEDPHAAFARRAFPSRFPELEGLFKERCAALGREIKIKANLTNPQGEKYVEGLEDADRKQLASWAAQWSRLRDLTKRAEYCGIYGGEAKTVYDSIVKDFPEVQLADLEKLVASVNREMAGVVAWRNRQEEWAHAHREIREKILGRVRLFPLGNFNPNVVYNFPIQAMAASLLALSIFRFTALTQPQLLEIDRLYRFSLLDASWVARMRAEGFDKWRAPVDLILNGHDSLLAESDEEDADKCTAFMEKCMHHEMHMPELKESVIFIGEAAKGRRWSDT